MNKVFRLLGSAALMAGLTLGGSAGAAFAGNDNYKDSHKSYDNHEKNKGHGDYRDRGNSHHHGYYRVYVCFDDHGRSHEWRDDDRKNDFWDNCRLITIKWY
jgi:hypothetical protein